MKKKHTCQRCGINDDKGKRVCEPCEAELQEKYDKAKSPFEKQSLMLRDELIYEVKENPVKLQEWNVKAQTLIVFHEINKMANEQI